MQHNGRYANMGKKTHLINSKCENILCISSVPSRGKKCAGARPFAGPTAHPFPNTSHICRFMTVGTMYKLTADCIKSNRPLQTTALTNLKRGPSTVTTINQIWAHAYSSAGQFLGSFSFYMLYYIKKISRPQQLK